MNNDLAVTILQASLKWKDPVANRALLADLIKTECDSSDLIVLPEMFTTGFCMDSEEVATCPKGETHQWLAEIAAQYDAVITGSYPVRIKQGVVNRLIWMRPDGSYEFYDKRHLFRMGDEHKHYIAGSKRLQVNINGWRCCPLICYDLRFPVWCRNYDDYDLLLFVANWPQSRADHWKTLLKARAIENLSYVVGVNPVGVDGNGQTYSGDSLVLDAQGKPLIDAKSSTGAFTVILSARELSNYRENFPAYLDADNFYRNI